MSANLTDLTAAELAAKLHSRAVSAREVTESFLSRVESLDSQYGAFLTVANERALADADFAQARLDEGTAGPLTGVPVALKDNISTEGIETTCASKILKGYVPPF